MLFLPFFDGFLTGPWAALQGGMRVSESPVPDASEK